MLRLAWETEALRLDATTVARGVHGAFAREPSGGYFVAEVQGSVAGCLMVTHEWSDWRNGDLWWIQSVYVDEPHRRRGYFRALYLAVRERARAAGAVGLRLYVERHNHRAKQTYLSLGMRATDYDMLMEDLRSSSS